jgi:hypothetical protein
MSKVVYFTSSIGDLCGWFSWGLCRAGIALGFKFKDVQGTSKMLGLDFPVSECVQFKMLMGFMRI